MHGYGLKGYIKKPKSSVVQQNLAYVKMQFISGGCLQDFVDLVGGKLTENEARFFIAQVVSLLEYLIKKMCYQANIGIQHFLLTNSLTLKLTKFGESHKDFWYLPPEMQGANNPHNRQNFVKSQIFQTGILMLKLVIGERFGETFSNYDNFYSYLGSKDISKLWVKLRLTRPDVRLTQNFTDLLEGMLAYKPENRISLDDIMSHPWMQSTNEQVIQTKEDLVFKTMEIQSLQNEQIKQILNEKKLEIPKNIFCH